MKKLFLLSLLLLAFTCKNTMHLAKVETSSYELSEDTPLSSNQEITDLIDPYKKELDKEINEVIGEAAISLLKGKPQSTLGNWMADLLHQKAEDYYGQAIDFAVVNYGGIRIPELRKGPITRSHVYEVMPFENRIVILKLNKEVTQQLFDMMASNGGWPISRQVSYLIDGDQATAVKVHGKALDASKIYKVAISDYVANGGDRCFFLKDQPRDELPDLLRDAIMKFVEEETAAGRKLDAEIDHRVKIKN